MKFGGHIQAMACGPDTVQVLSQRVGAGPDSASKIQALLGLSSVVAHLCGLASTPSITKKNLKNI